MLEVPGSMGIYDPRTGRAGRGDVQRFHHALARGFGGGRPYTPERVHDWLDKSTAVANLITFDEAGAPVGYCGLYPHYRDRHACYVTVLGVVPRVKGHKFGRRLLLRAGGNHHVRVAVPTAFNFSPFAGAFLLGLGEIGPFGEASAEFALVANPPAALRTPEGAQALIAALTALR